jgi:carbamoyltransferase
VALRLAREWAARACEDHQRWHAELEDGLRELGLLAKLKRSEHHLSHAANAYLASGFDRALIVTIDGYGSGLAGSVSIGEGGRIRRLKNLKFPHSLGSFYEMVTSSLGFHPDRHAGKIVGLAAYGDPHVLSDALLARVVRTPGDFRLIENLNVHFSRHLAARFPMIDVAAAYQRVLEIVATDLVRHWARETGSRNVVLSGGVTANVKLNQRIHELDEVENTFVYPNMGDGGCGTGLALMLSWPGGIRPSIEDVYWGPSYSAAEIQAELERNGLAFDRPADLVGEVARRIHAGEVIGRFDGRMEYGPRALGNRSILYHAREPEVNQWLNKRLGRTEFMPFAPVTLWEARERCYVNLAGAEHAAEFMTITFDCTPWMRQNCPAAVHVDGTARPQLVRREVNPGYWEVLKAYESIAGIPCLINTSFNMHEEPIVCSPNDAVRAFLLGNIDGLAIGPFFVPHPSKSSGSAGVRAAAVAGAR